MENESSRGYRKIKKGQVVSNKMQKTVVVRVNRKLRHPQYGKVVSRSKKFYAHCEGEMPAIGDTVTIRETKPLSKLKRWMVIEWEKTA